MCKTAVPDDLKNLTSFKRYLAQTYTYLLTSTFDITGRVPGQFIVLVLVTAVRFSVECTVDVLII